MRVLTLNFSNVFGHGLPFDSITTSGTIHNGIATTQDFELVTAPARATMSGTIDLVDRQQSLVVKVIPTVNLGTAAVARRLREPADRPGGSDRSIPAL
ncbi:MAG: AsmA-like C-terminal region-containing protein [Pararobbsia sp.]